VEGNSWWKQDCGYTGRTHGEGECKPLHQAGLKALAAEQTGNEGQEPRPDAATQAVAPVREKPPARPTTVVRYGRMGYVGEFTCHPSIRPFGGTRLVVQTDRGIELGEQINLACSTRENCIDCDQVRKYAEVCGPEYLRLNAGRVIRVATDADLSEAHHLHESERERIRICARFVEQRGLPMKIVDCEHLLGGERIIFYFMAEGRIDFRELVRDLAHEFRTRIEMRQVGARDEARLVADYETCGRQCCCKNFLKTLKPVNMKMAKMQKATLDPSKVSGRCGRLKCCLRFENETYEELDRKLPRMGSRIRSHQGEGTVVDRQILTQLVVVEMDDGRRVSVPVEDVTATDLPFTRSPTQPRPEGRGEGRFTGRPPRGHAETAENTAQGTIPDPACASKTAGEPDNPTGRPVEDSARRAGESRRRRRQRGSRARPRSDRANSPHGNTKQTGQVPPADTNSTE